MAIVAAFCEDDRRNLIEIGDQVILLAFRESYKPPCAHARSHYGRVATNFPDAYPAWNSAMHQVLFALVRRQ